MGSGSRAEGQANRGKFVVDALAVRQVGGRAGQVSAPEGPFAAAGRENRRRAVPGTGWCEVDGEKGHVPSDVRVQQGEAVADAAVALSIWDDGGTEEFVPIRGRDGEGRQHDGPDPIRPSLGE